MRFSDLCFNSFFHSHSTVARNQTTHLVPCQTATLAGSFRRTPSPPKGGYPSPRALVCWLQLGLTTPLYTEIRGCLCQLFSLVGQTRKGYRGVRQDLQQKVGPRTSLTTGLHLQLCCLNVDYLGSWHGPQLGRRYTT